MSIEVTNITKKYGEQIAVNDLSFSLNKGEIVGFLGPNGAGKSTMMKIITGYLKQDSGTVKINGLNTITQTLETKKAIGYLPEHNPLYLDMYIKEYLEFCAKIHGVNSIKIEDTIRLVGLNEEKHKKIKQLSKGYRQRVGLASALLHDPDILILDEPTTGLDPNQLVEIRSLIKKVGEEKTVLFSSHILQEVEAICNRVIIIKKGNIVADDTIKDLTKNKSLTTLFSELTI